MTESNKPVLIIGAGISGLALAQGLKKAGIPFHVFESDPSPAFRPQGYRFRIQGNGIPALRELLPADLFERFEKVCAVTVLGFGNINAFDGSVQAPNRGPMGGAPGGGPPGGGPPGPMGIGGGLPGGGPMGGGISGRGPPGTKPGDPMPYTADRTVTRDVLLRGLTENITFGKRLERYETKDNGTVLVFFADGSSAEGILLVGAEGVRSVVRKQYLPSHIVLDTELRCIYGKTKLTPEFEARFNKNGLKHITVIQDRSDEFPLTLFLEPIRFQSNELQDILPDDYVYWVLAMDRQNLGDMPDAEFLQLYGPAAAQLSMKLTKGWDQSVKVLLEMQDVEAAAAFRIELVSSDSLTWKSSANVTLVGDSVHVFPPAGALGANSALEDAASLTRALKKGINLDSITEYDLGMQARAREGAAMSGIAGKHLLGMRDPLTLKPLES